MKLIYNEEIFSFPWLFREKSVTLRQKFAVKRLMKKN